MKLLNYFEKNIAPKYKTLHEAFEECKKNNETDLNILNEIYKTYVGQEYLKGYYKKIPN